MNLTDAWKENGGGSKNNKPQTKLFRICAILLATNGGDLASTWVAKPEVHAEVQDTS
jgi:hypothetical protein